MVERKANLMKYLIEEKISYNYEENRNARSKAREDIDAILTGKIDFCILDFTFNFKEKKKNLISKISRHISRLTGWKKGFDSKKLKKGDLVLIQYPMFNYPRGFNILLACLKKKGVITVAIIHDLESVRFPDKKMYKKEKATLNEFDYLIDHNSKMRNKLLDMNVNRPKLIDLNIFDYLIGDRCPNDNNINSDEIIIAGNLTKEKCGYIYGLPNDIKFGLYGVGYQGTANNIRYYGSYLPEEVPFMIMGKFGLVWDGPSSKTCEDDFGNYLRFNNPHKTSLYLSVGIPVIAWDESAIADFVISNRCGITISSLGEIRNKLQSIDLSEYEVMVANAKRVSEKVKSGYFTVNAIESVLNDIDLSNRNS